MCQWKWHAAETHSGQPTLDSTMNKQINTLNWSSYTCSVKNMEIGSSKKLNNMDTTKNMFLLSKEKIPDEKETTIRWQSLVTFVYRIAKLLQLGMFCYRGDVRCIVKLMKLLFGWVWETVGHFRNKLGLLIEVALDQRNHHLSGRVHGFRHLHLILTLVPWHFIISGLLLYLFSLKFQKKLQLLTIYLNLDFLNYINS